MQIIGAGVGRTGTHSLKLALNQLGLGPCHHMEEVLSNMPSQVPLWSRAVDGSPDWEAIFGGYESAVDWPTAGFFRELLQAYPSAKFVLTHRSPETWADSFSETIYKVLAEKDRMPPEIREWLQMCEAVIAKSGFPPGLSRDELIDAFVLHNEAVKATVPANQLLVFEVKDGWAPLCAFLGVSTPDEPFPRTNNRTEFWDLIPG